MSILDRYVRPQGPLAAIVARKHAERVAAEMRESEAARAETEKKAAWAAWVKKSLEWSSMSNPGVTKSIEISEIIDAVAKECGVARDRILCRLRAPSYSLPRHIAMFLARKITDKSFPEIGKKFAGRDHTTVIHAVRKIERLAATDTSFAAKITRVERELRARHRLGSAS
jgi:chromosomal replication initiation ATPase DnaA